MEIEGSMQLWWCLVGLLDGGLVGGDDRRLIGVHRSMVKGGEAHSGGDEAFNCVGDKEVDLEGE